METSRITTTGRTWKGESRTTLYGSVVGTGSLLKSAISYAMPSEVVGCRFTAILDAEWRGVLGKSWNSERPLVFAHVVLTKTFGVCRVR